MRGLRLLDNLNGTDLVPDFLRRQTGIRCFLVGSAPDRIGRAAETFRQLFPNSVLVGTHHGYLDERSSLTVVKAINAAAPDVILVGMGNPLQERWIMRYRARIHAPLCIGVGGLLEYWTGSLDRAPLWMRRLGIEWLHILSRQPWKAGRYLVGSPAFLVRSLLWRPLDLASRPAAGGASHD